MHKVQNLLIFILSSIAVLLVLLFNCFEIKIRLEG
jgi:hypothetical protein